MIINTLMPEQNGRRLADDILKCIPAGLLPSTAAVSVSKSVQTRYA